MFRSEDNRNELENILQELIASSDKPTPQLLADYVQKHPRFAQEIISFASEWALQESMSQSEMTNAIDEQVTIARANSELQNALFRFDQKTVSFSSNEVDPFAGKTINDLKALATKLDVDRPLIAKIRDRKIQPATIPPRFSEDLAAALSVPLECIIAYHEKPPVVYANMNFKSRTTPQVMNQQTFEEALRGSARYEEIKRRWKLA